MVVSEAIAFFSVNCIKLYSKSLSVSPCEDLLFDRLSFCSVYEVTLSFGLAELYNFAVFATDAPAAQKSLTWPLHIHTATCYWV